MSDPLQFKDIMSLLNTANKTLDNNIYIPSLKADIASKTLNANHTKNIIKTTVEGAFADNQFTLIVYHILLDIFGDALNLEKLNIYDKEFILLQLRSKNIRDDYEVILYNANDEHISKTISISKHIEKIKKGVPAFEEQIIDVTNNDTLYKIIINIPTIKEEYTFANNLYQEKLSKIVENDAKQLKSLIAPMFLSHAAPFIEKIIIDTNEIDLTTLSVNERISIVEQIPSKPLLSIIDKIDTIYGKEMKTLTHINKTMDGVIYSGRIAIDANFFVN